MTGIPTRGEARIRLREQAARYYLAGASIKATARHIERSYGCTRTLLVEAGITFRKRGNGSNFRKTAD